MIPNIQGIIFDFGSVIASPKSGIWTIPANINSYFARWNLRIPTEEELRIAQAQASILLESNHTQKTMDDEYELFKGYYEELLKSLGIRNDILAIASEFAHDGVYSDEHIFFYPDVYRVIFTLFNSGYKLGILSDNWPSLLSRLERMNIRKCMKTIVISSIEECCKPNEKIFQIVIQRMELPSRDLLFVDDDLENIEAADKLGFNVVLMDRHNKQMNCSYSIVRSFDEIIEMVKSSRK
jgi:putative hydrolase of the HAD superfamily